MTLLDRLQTHRGGLIQIKTQLYWYGGRGWDGSLGRICLVLDAACDAQPAATAAAHTLGAELSRFDFPRIAVALLLVDGSPHWVWVVAKDIELLT